MSTNPTENQLLEKARQGDFKAFADLTEPHRRSACEFLVRLTGEDAAEDVFMTATLNAWKAIGSFSGKSSYRTWLFSIARYAALDHLRKIKSRKEVSADDDESAANIASIRDDAAQHPAQQLQDEERARIIEASLQKLPEHHRTPLVLFYYQDFQYSEIAETLGISIGTVMSRLHHAKAKLSKLLEQHRQDIL
ncbi:MAG: RNA polymerase sigma factor [Kiritimatiellia bacterium]|jgi:RNA polymerase sigma-70 factor (ECF subfamily)